LDTFKERVIIQAGVPSIEEFDAILNDIDKYCSLNEDIRMVCIDSVASIYRGTDTSQSSFVNRAKKLCGVMRRLKRMAENYNLCIISVNQVSAVIDELNPFANMMGSQNKTRATLGLVWSNCLHARIIMECKENSRMTASREFKPAIKRRKLNPDDDEVYYVDHEQCASHKISMQKRELLVEFSSYALTKPCVCKYMIDNRGLRGLEIVNEKEIAAGRER